MHPAPAFVCAVTPPGASELTFPILALVFERMVREIVTDVGTGKRLTGRVYNAKILVRNGTYALEAVIWGPVEYRGDIDLFKVFVLMGGRWKLSK